METGETIKKGLLRLERYAQNIPGGFHCCAEDPENGYPFAYISDRFLEILGWERAEFAARFDNRYTALVHPDDLADGLRYRNAENSATYAQEGDSIFRMLGKNGYRWVSSAANRVEWHGDGYIVGTITDITPYMELREKLEQQNRTQREALETANRNLLRMMQQMEEQKTQFAKTTARNMEKEERYRQRLNHDALTGTYNRRYYEDVVRNNLGPAGIALMDIDDFKICNDTYGHHAGDLALETVAKTIRSCIRETDLLIRYGGDEFLLVLSGIPADYLKTKLEQIRDAVQKAVVPGYPHFRLSLSIGGAMQTLADPMENVVRRADLLMYQAKNHKDAVAVDTQDSRLAAQEQVLEEKPVILLVDDAMMNRMMLAGILGGDYRILEAGNGKQCLELLREKAGQISLVLLDINMPVMDGFEVLRTMNTNHTIEDVPVIMISSDDSEEAIRKGLETVSWPGRFELLRHSPAFLLDGSHNAHGMRATVQSLRDRFPGQKFVFLLSIMADKDVDEMLALLLPLAKQFVTVAAHPPRAMPRRWRSTSVCAAASPNRLRPSKRVWPALWSWAAAAPSARWGRCIFRERYEGRLSNFRSDPSYNLSVNASHCRRGCTE